ncbi:ATP-grasp domain-containing protein [Nguyenibacter vanlangensis]|uniref:ATP-grasp domain-containing protein n=1 Tax=Nguyenibacter vanlangensis TaxID=1216886 RepID=A0A7Y7IT14_9PROT|nr:hypothetical protein [Nguyenibacter vanlangensis]NVN09785.1 hypothetical protein [Nguyenibacter vanlangensis]
MKRIALLTREEGPAFTDLAGHRVIASLNADIVVLAARGDASSFKGLRNVTVEVVRWDVFDDESALLEIVSRHHAIAPFDAILTLNELLVGRAASLRAALGVPGMTPSVAEGFRDKILMKERVSAAGVAVPRHGPATSRELAEEILKAHGRLVLKPRAECGSRGVVFCRDMAAYDAWVEEFASSKRGASIDQYELEEFVDGTLYHVNGLVIGGTLSHIAIAPYLPGRANIDFTAGTPFVSAMLEPGALHDELAELAQKSVTGLGMERGVIHLEAFAPAGKPAVFCEVAARTGGGGIIWMIEAQYGWHLPLAALQVELGNAPAPVMQAGHTFTAGLIGLRHARGGIVSAAPSEASFQDPWILRKQVNVAQGQFRASCAHCTDFIGLFILQSDGIDDFEQKAALIEERFYEKLELTAL